jgi:AMP nucleosidase
LQEASLKTKKEIVDNWLPRYTGTALKDFGRHVLLTNFGNYLEIFARLTGTEIVGRDRPMPNATADGITMIMFGMGSATRRPSWTCCRPCARSRCCCWASAAG